MRLRAASRSIVIDPLPVIRLWMFIPPYFGFHNIKYVNVMKYNVSTYPPAHKPGASITEPELGITHSLFIFFNIQFQTIAFHNV
jgi:hypothetical protein